MSQSPALKYLENNNARFKDELIELLRIPSISRDPERKAEMDKAAEWLADKLRTMGVNNVEIMPTAGIPAVYGEKSSFNKTFAALFRYCQMAFGYHYSDFFGA